MAISLGIKGGINACAPSHVSRSYSLWLTGACEKSSMARKDFLEHKALVEMSPVLDTWHPVVLDAVAISLDQGGTL